uniref:RecQ mediated genome instability protein 1-like N-terminal helical domain-containing protein n=1 Tax=Panagrolaimus sp. PS1159 TaxID=55785 RepID=A0AC35FVV8_9BILA
MDEELTSVRSFFDQRHIVLNNEWEENVIRYVDKGADINNLPELVFEQWLYSDLRESTRSSLNIPAKANFITVVKPALLQLMSIVDISDSYYSQYRSEIIDLSKDDSEFHDPSENPREQEKTKHGTKNIINFCVQAPKKPMYMYEFSDGNIIIKAVASDKIYGLHSTTHLGAKILLIPKYVSRNRVIKLTSKNCQFLGGYNDRCMEENSNPLKVLCQKLGKNYEDAVLQASKSKNQLNQTMNAAAILQQPQSTVVQAMKAPQPLQKPQPAVVQTVQRQPALIQPPTKTDTMMTTLIQPSPLQKETLQPTPKKPEPISPPKKLQEAVNGEMESAKASNEQSLNDSGVNSSDTFSSFSSPPKRQPPPAPAVNEKNKFNADITAKNLDDTSFSLTDSFFSFPSPPKYQPPKPPTVAVNNDIHDYDISDTTLNDYGSAGKSTLKPTSIQKPKQTFLKPTVTIMPPSNVQVDGFKRPLPFVRQSNNVNSSLDAASMSPPKKNPKFDNNKFKKPFLPDRKPATVQRPISDDFVPETPADDSDENSKPHENTGKSFSELLAMDSETEFMEAIEEQRRHISALPWTPMTKSLSPLYDSQKFNFSQSSDRFGSQGKSPEIDSKRSEEEMEDESPTQNSIFSPEYDAFNLGTSNDSMDRKRNISNRQKIHAIHCEIDSGFSINKWSLLVKVSTETHQNVVMVVGKELLTSLLGITSDRLKKAMAEKNAYELDRCKENGQQMRKIFERQDLVLEVEYPSEPSSFPVIKKIKKLSSAPNNV